MLNFEYIDKGGFRIRGVQLVKHEDGSVDMFRGASATWRGQVYKVTEVAWKSSKLVSIQLDCDSLPGKEVAPPKKARKPRASKKSVKTAA